MKKLLFAMCIVTCLLPAGVYAAPSITGSNTSIAVHGQGGVTITGTDFGTKVSPEPELYEDWSGGVNGEELGYTGFWNVSSDNAVGLRPQYANDNLRNDKENLNASFYWTRTETTGQDLVYHDTFSLTGRDCYFDTWIYHDYPSTAYDTHQVKLFKLASQTGDLGGEYPTFNHYEWTYSSSLGCYLTYSNASTNVVADYFNCSYNEASGVDSWHHWQLYLRNSTEGGSDGEYYLYRNGNLIASGSGYAFRRTGDNPIISLWLGRYLGNNDHLQLNFYYSTTYFDDYWQHIEIGDNAVYSNCTVTEVQNITSWSDTSATFTVNQGSIPNGTAYVFLVDENREVSGGYPITLSDTTTSDPYILNSSDSTPEDGQPVTLSGYNFGANGLSYEWLGDDIEAGTVGNQLSVTNWLFNYEGDEDNRVASDQAHSGSYSLYSDLTANVDINGAARYDYGSDIPPNGTTIYTTWWARRSHVSDGQWKMFRINYRNDISDDAPQIAMFNNDASYNDDYMLIRPGPTTGDNSEADYPPYYEDDGQWFRLELVYNLATGQGVSDGSYEIFQHVPGSSSVSSIQSNSGLMTDNDPDQDLRWFLWQNYCGSGISSMSVWLDDMYIQVGTQARVELGDASTWSACTFRDIQPATSWSSSSVTINFNQGGFDVGDTAYLYVVDNNGVVNTNGYPVTIAASTGGDTTAPTVVSTSVNNDVTTVNFSETVDTSGYDNGDFTMTCSTTGSVSLNSISGSGSTRTFTNSSDVVYGETCTLAYTGTTDEIEDTTGNDLATFSGAAVTNNTTGDTEAPTIVSATVASSGTSITLVFSESMTGYPNGDFNVDGSSGGDDLEIGGQSGSGTTFTYTIYGTVYSGDTMDLDYVLDAGTLQDVSGNPLAAFADFSVTNNSTQTYEEPSSSAYYVTQAGGSTGAGTSADPYSLADFNAISSVDTSAGDVTFYFSGTFTSSIVPLMSGSATGNVILDGYEAGSCNHLSGTPDTNGALISGPASGTTNAITLGNLDYMIIQDFRIADWYQGIYHIATASGTAGALDYFTIRRVAFEDTLNRAITITASNYGYQSCNYLTIENCLLHNSAAESTTSYGAGIILYTGYDVRIAGNYIYNDKSYALQTNGPDGMSIINSHRCLIENNRIDHMGEDGVDIKCDDDDPEVHGDHIVRFNNISNVLQSCVVVQHGIDPVQTNRDGSNVYIYGNKFWGSSTYPTSGDLILVQRGFHEVAIWSNLLYGGNKSAVNVRNQSTGEYVDNVFIANNTMVANRISDTAYQTAAIALWHRSSGTYQVYNNILYNNAVNDSDYDQMYVPSWVQAYVTMNNNLYGVVSGTPRTHWNDGYISLTSPMSSNALCTTYGEDCSAVVTNSPGFTAYSSNNYTLTSGSAAVNAGANLDSLYPSWWDVPTIQGVDYSSIATLDLALSPTLTDFDSIPSSVTMVDQGTSWEIGAYYYGTSDTTPPTVVSATIDGDTVTINFSENVVMTGYVAGTFNVDSDGAVGTDIALSSPSGSGASWTFTAATAVTSTETVNLDYTGTGVEDANGNDLATFSNTSVTNVTESEASPTISSVTVDSTGKSVTIVFSETMLGYPNGGFDLDGSSAGDDLEIGGQSGSGTTFTYTVYGTIYSGDTVDLDFDSTSSTLRNAGGLYLTDFSDFSVTNNSEVVYSTDTTAPTVTSAYTSSAGSTLFIFFDEAVYTDGYAEGDFTLVCSSTGSQALNVIGSGGSSLRSTGTTEIEYGETCTLTFSGDTISVVDAAGNPLATFEDMEVTNNTEYEAPSGEAMKMGTVIMAP